MAKKRSSPRKPTKKAATRTRSTTSSTTARHRSVARKPTEPPLSSDPSDSSDPSNVDSNGEPAPRQRLSLDPSQIPQLTPEEQDEYLHLLSRGASPAAACLQLNLSVLGVLNQITTDESFRNRIDQIHNVLSQNVAAALYRSAMEGSVSAQTFFLKNCPPPEWPGPEISPSGPVDDLDQLSDAEIQELMRREQIDDSDE